MSAAQLLAAEWQNYSDDELVRRILSGDTGLFEILMRRYNRRIFRAALAILRDEAEAEEVMQEAYVRAYQHLGDFAGKAKFSTWLTKIAVYEAMARVKTRGKGNGSGVLAGRKLESIEAVRSEARDPEREAYDHELKSVLERAVHKLPDEYRSVFMLRVVEGLDANETAAALDLSIEAVKTRLHRGRKMLRKELERRAGIVACNAFPFHLSRCDHVVEGVFGKLFESRP